MRGILCVLISAAAVSKEQPGKQCVQPAIFSLSDIDVSTRSGDALSSTNWHNSAITLYNQRKADLAIQHQIMATKAFPFGGPVWDTLGGMLINKVAMLPSDDEERLPLICEAVAATELASVLGDHGESASVVLKRSTERINYALMLVANSDACAHGKRGRQLTPEEAQECLAQYCFESRPIYARARGVLLPALGQPQESSHYWHVNAPQKGWHRIAKHLCRPDPSDVTVQLSPIEEERGVLSAVSSFEIYMLWRVCGVVAVPKTFSTSVIERTRQQVVDVDLARHMPRIEEHQRERLKSRSAAATAERSDEDDFEDESLASRDNTRSASRYELTLPHATSPYSDAGLADSEMLRNVVKLLLLDARVTIDTFSAVVSLPKCPEMHWHRDAPDIFKRWVSSDGEAPTPSMGLVAAVPLVNVSAAINGPTEFLMGSHVVSDGRWGTRPDGSVIDPEIRPLHIRLDALAGSAVFFDMRLRHRGGSNPSDEIRPILYLGFTLSWYTGDSVNFKRPHTADWARDESVTRRTLFSRLDTAAYTRRLEEELLKRSADLSDFKASDVDGERDLRL